MVGLVIWLKEMFSGIGKYLDIRSDSYQYQIDRLRELDLDIAIDLSGWTSNSTPIFSLLVLHLYK